LKLEVSTFNFLIRQKSGESIVRVKEESIVRVRVESIVRVRKREKLET
jgi:hypothetical protein